MSKFPDEIDVNSHQEVIKCMDYIVTDGVAYKVLCDDFNRGVYLTKIDRIPEEYYEEN